MQSWRWVEFSGYVAWENIVVPIGNLLDDASQDLTRPIHTPPEVPEVDGGNACGGQMGFGARLVFGSDGTTTACLKAATGPIWSRTNATTSSTTSN